MKSSAVPPSSHTIDSAYIVKVSHGAAMRDVVVEFTAPSSLTSVGYAEEVTRPYLSAPEPPRHLVVDVDGAVEVLVGPLAASEEAETGPVVREAGRARPRRRS